MPLLLVTEYSDGMSTYLSYAWIMSTLYRNGYFAIGADRHRR